MSKHGKIWVVHSLYTPEDLIRQYTEPGQRRRSLLKMVGTDGEYAARQFIEKQMWKALGRTFPTITEACRPNMLLNGRGLNEAKWMH